MNRMMKESTLPFMNMQATSSKSNPPDLDFEDTSTIRQTTSRVFKKSSANGKITVYLGKRDFVDHITHVDPIDGVVLIDPGYVSNRKVFVQILAAFRYGREDLDVLGLSFRKDLFMTSKQVCPASSNEDLDKPLTKLQERLIKKLGPNAKPFVFEVPPLCPSSVTLQPTPGDTSKPCGVDYELTAYIGNNSEDKAQKKNTVGLSIRKIIYAPSKQDGEQPSVEVTKEFMLKPNKIHLEASLDRELYHHGESLSVNVHIANNSSKTVKKIKVSVRQFADICLFSTAQYKCTVAEVESDDGCQVQPGFTLSKVFKVTPLLMNNKDKWGLALDGQLKDEDTNLASSTFIADHTQRESLGIIVQYKVRVKLFMSPFGGELVAELPFILMHPKPYGLNDMDLICKEFISPSKGTSIKSNRSSFNSINVIAKPEEPDLIEIEADEETVFENLALKRM